MTIIIFYNIQIVIIAFIVHRSSFFFFLSFFSLLAIILIHSLATQLWSTLDNPQHTECIDSIAVFITFTKYKLYGTIFLLVVVCAKIDIWCTTYFDYGNCCKSSIKRLTFPFGSSSSRTDGLEFCFSPPANIFHWLNISHAQNKNP